MPVSGMLRFFGLGVCGNYIRQDTCESFEGCEWAAEEPVRKRHGGGGVGRCQRKRPAERLHHHRLTREQMEQMALHNPQALREHSQRLARLNQANKETLAELSRQTSAIQKRQALALRRMQKRQNRGDWTPELEQEYQTMARGSMRT